jgi:hypothetical protein
MMMVHSIVALSPHLQRQILVSVTPLSLVERVRQLGWREIEVIDEQLGRFAFETMTRFGFDCMLAEVCLEKVGRLLRAKYSDLRATVGNGNNWAKFAVCRYRPNL